jgi:hypothetical protein
VNTENQFDWLDLPPILEVSQRSPLLYGADHVLYSYIKPDLFPTNIKGEWVHGVHFPFEKNSPLEHIGGNYHNKNSLHLVPRKDIEEYLLSEGYLAKAIGMPICYLPNKLYQRKRSSLLIMPPHSTFYIAQHSDRKDSRFTEYIDYLKKQSAYFTIQGVSIHNECLKRGLWVNEFAALKIPIVQGASVSDSNALDRIRALMYQFDYVTGISFGSHTAYAAAFGAKVSVAGGCWKESKKEFLKDPFYQENPKLLDYRTEYYELARQYYPFLFVEPKDSQQHIDWGQEMIGMNNVLPAKELARLLKVDPVNEIARRAYRFARSAARISMEKLHLR